jgi:hypothetical protein
MAERGDHPPAVEQAKSMEVSGKRWQEVVITYSLRAEKRRRSAARHSRRTRSHTHCERGKVAGSQQQPMTQERRSHTYCGRGKVEGGSAASLCARRRSRTPCGRCKIDGGQRQGMAERGNHPPAVKRAKSKEVSGKQWRNEAITYRLWNRQSRRRSAARDGGREEITYILRAGKRRRRSVASDGGKRRPLTFCGRGKVEGQWNVMAQ